MTKGSLPRTTEEFSRLIEECVLATRRSTGAQVVDTAELYRLANIGDPHSRHNGIFRTQFDDHNADRLIDEQDRFFRSHKLNFRWLVCPHSRPADLNARLQRLAPKEVIELHGLYVPTDNSLGEPSDEFTIEEISEANIEEYIETNIAGWKSSESLAASLRRSIRQDWKNGFTGRQGFLARSRGIAAASSTMRIVNGIGYLCGGATRPDFRGKGAYRALVHHRIALLRAQRVPLALILAIANTSSPICRRLGFQVGCECREYKFHPLDVA